MPRRQLIDLTGQQFGHWKVLEHAGMKQGRAGALWLCECGVCGKKRKVSSWKLRHGVSKSCGCHKENLHNRVHGYAPHGKRTSEYVSWAKIVQRCYNPNCPEYRWYGAKGIRMCRAWRKSFTAFLADVGPKPGPGYVMGRFNHTRNYEPKNCRWITRSDNSIETNKGYRPVGWSDTYSHLSLK